MASNALPPIPPDIARTAGPLLIGYLINWGLFGVLSTQVYFYYLAFPQDMRRTKVLVYGIYLFEMAQTIMLTQTGFATFATGFGDLNAINHIGVIWFAVPIMDSLVAFVVQAFYAYRIAVLSRSMFMPAVILLFGFLQLGGGLATGYFGAKAIHFNDFLGKKTFISTALWNGGGAMCDIIIASSMTYFLSKSKTDWKPTKNIIQRLIRLIIETGTLTAAMAIVNLALSVLPGGPTYFQTTSSMLGKMYSNTMMVVLNSRARIGNVEAISTGTLSSEYMTQRTPVFRNMAFREDEENGPGPP
ncbi:hypothetical protein GALMADRAFT_254773 [Galerina marginata CBS 339.88]|uniref:DUF6534 domain-containing protein n=1 Tax=Galerina marginata (strain CBS 339.88) TaxID=685588 RepID=A0A067SIJ7_GALM3|nr:hypothetical protein GALMADRAFT_254773 [Galerina marginata CBS 339.88]